MKLMLNSTKVEVRVKLGRKERNPKQYWDDLYFLDFYNDLGSTWHPNTTTTVDLKGMQVVELCKENKESS